MVSAATSGDSNRSRPLIAMAVPARVGERRRAVIPGIAVDVSIPGIEAVVAGPGAAVAPA